MREKKLDFWGDFILVIKDKLVGHFLHPTKLNDNRLGTLAYLVWFGLVCFMAYQPQWVI